MIAAASCIALLAAACTRDSGLKAGDAATLDEASAAELSVDGGPWTDLAGGQAVPVGARVRATEDEARLAFRDGTARLAAGATAVVEEETLTLQRGDVLVESDGGLSVVSVDTEIAGAGTVRVSSGLASRVAVYRGSATVSRPSQEREVAALRQLELSDFRLAADGDPLRYRDGDAWDQELLADAIAFDGEAARLARGIDVEFGTAPQPRSFYAEFTQRAVVPLLRSAAPVTRGSRFGPASDVLLTAFVADAAPGAAVLREGVRTVTALRAEGARWGLIAVELDVRSEALVAAIDTIGSEQLALADRSSGPGGGGADTGGGSGDAGDSGTGGGPTPDGPGGSSDPAPSDGGDGAPSPPGEDPRPRPDPRPDPPAVPDAPSDPDDPEGTVEEVVSEVADVVGGDDDKEEDSLPDLPLPDVPLPLLKDLPLIR